MDPEYLKDVFASQGPLFVPLSVMAFVLGSCIGSFLNVVIWRLPRGESIVHVPSHCPKCNFQLKPWHNIPIVSWLALGGKCAKCRAPITIRYLVVEAITGLLYLGLFIRTCQGNHPLPSWMAANMVLAAILVADTWIDFDHMEIPLQTTIFGLVTALVLAAIWPGSHLFRPDSPPANWEQFAYFKPLTASLAQIFSYIEIGSWQPFGNLLGSSRKLALFEYAMGIFLGGGFLWVLVEIGKLLLGRRKVQLGEDVVMTLDERGLTTDEEDDEPIEWEDLLARPTDKLKVWGEVLTVEREDGASVPVPPRPDHAEGPVLVLTEEQVKVAGGLQLTFAELKSMTLRTRRWVEPREAMGMGDVHLLAVIGAFNGPGAAFAALGIGSVLGGFVSAVLMLSGQAKLSSRLPFGPYIAFGAVMHMLFGHQLLQLYARYLGGVWQRFGG